MLWSASRPIANVGGSFEMNSVPVNAPMPSIHAGACLTNVPNRTSTPTMKLVRSLAWSNSIAA